MKKIIAILLVLTMLFGLCACGKQEEPQPQPQQPEDPQQEEPQQPVNPPEPEKELTEDDQAYWEKKFPGKTISSFQIFEDGGLKTYYFSTDIKTLPAWVSTDFNWTGWHFDDSSRFLLNENETLRVTDDSLNAKLEAFITVFTEDYDPQAEPEDNYVLGKLVTVDERSDFQLNSLYLWGNYHEEEERFYDVEGINSDFYLNEYIDFYPDYSFSGNTDRVKIIIVHHRPLDTLLRTSYDDFCLDCSYAFYLQELDSDGYMDSACLSPGNEEGLYDILFCCDEKLVCYMVAEFKDYNGYD